MLMLRIFKDLSAYLQIENCTFSHINNQKDNLEDSILERKDLIKNGFELLTLDQNIFSNIFIIYIYIYTV
jgi:hypothetical protein